MTANLAAETQTVPTPWDPLNALRRVNARLGLALLHMRPEQNHCSAITPQDFSDLRGQIQRGAACLSSLAADSTVDSREESAAYRGHLESLQRFLPDLQACLLAEKSRMESARDQLTGTAAWLHAREKTI